jgi:hypothetical protein
MMQAMAHNIFDNYSPNVKVIATPYSPPVITAINRTDQRIKHLSEHEYRLNTERQIWEDLGLYIDWERDRLVDQHGNYLKSVLQLDSLTFLITIENKSWPCVPPTLVFSDAHGFLIAPYDYPCYTPNITHLEDNIYLENDRGEILRANRVWGRQRDQLTMEETLLAKFTLREGNHHFLQGAGTMLIVIKGFDEPVKLELPVSSVGLDFRQF